MLTLLNNQTVTVLTKVAAGPQGPPGAISGAPHVTNLIQGDGAGGVADSGINPSNVVQKQTSYPTPSTLNDIITLLQSAGLSAAIAICASLFAASAFAGTFGALPKTAIVSIPNDVWIAIRTDSLPGDGSSVYPFDGSTQAKFDAILASYAATPDMHFHLGPGTFQTVIEPANLWHPQNGWVIEGRGMDITSLQAVPSGFAGLTNDAEVIKVPFNQALTGFTVKDITLDGNFPNCAPVMDNGSGSRTFSDGVTVSGSATLSSATADFRLLDLFRTVAGAGVPTSPVPYFIRIPATIIGASSDGVSMTGTYVININSATGNGTADFTSAGTLLVESTATRFNVISYTGKTSSSFTGCTGGSGTMFVDGKVTTGSQIVMTAPATASATVTITEGGEKKCTIAGITAIGSNITLDHVRSINAYGSAQNIQEAFPIYFTAPNLAGAYDITNNHALHCEVTSVYGSYANGIAFSGWSSNHPMRDSSAEFCRITGVNDGYSDQSAGGGVRRGSGISNGGIGGGNVSNLKVVYNYEADVGTAYYCDTGSINGLLYEGNTVIRSGGGPTLVQGSSDPTWTNNNVIIRGNYIGTQNRTAGGDGQNDFRFLGSNSNTNFTVDNNYCDYDSTGGRGTNNGHALLGENISGLRVTNNTFNNHGKVFQFTGSTGLFKAGNRDPNGNLLTDQDGLVDSLLAPVTLYAKNVTVLTAGTPADIATINVPFPRWRVRGQTSGVGNTTDGLIYAETASGTLAAASVSGWTATGGTGTQMMGAVNLPAAASSAVPWYPQLTTNLATSSTLVIRQTANAANAGTATFYVPIEPLP